MRALTGIETDRLAEEKRRGISIELGFAHLTLKEDVNIAFIDVPGHERFIKNMLAGVSGIDGVLFIVAANESIQPQTREHFEICRLLQVRQGVIALTKADLIDGDILDLVRLEVAELTEGSFLQSAAMVAVSSVTGEGLDRLRDELGLLASHIPRREAATYFRMPIDRVFAVQGFGAVVTGTIVAGTVERESELQVYPSGQVVRVRGIQVHGAEVRLARAGQRAALNLSGVQHTSLQRGSVLSEPSVFRSTLQFDASLELLSTGKPLKTGARVHFHTGTVETEARVRTLGTESSLQPGASGLVRVVLASPMLLLPGDRFIVRMFSPVTTIGGGEVLEIAPPGRQRRSVTLEHARFLMEAQEFSARLAVVVQASIPGISLENLVARTGRRPKEIRSALPAEVAEKGGWFFTETALSGLQEAWRTRLRGFHQEFPLLRGMSKEAFRVGSAAAVPPAVFELLLGGDAQLAVSEDVVYLASHQVAYREDEAAALDRIAFAFAMAGLSVPSVEEVLAGCGVEKVRARSLLQILLREHRLVRVGADLVFHPSSLQKLTDLLGTKVGQRFSVSDFKAWTSVSRKYAIPLLEYFDRQRLTYRDGETRVVAPLR